MSWEALVVDADPEGGAFLVWGGASANKGCKAT